MNDEQTTAAAAERDGEGVALDAGARFRYESELRRLRTRIEIDETAMGQLTERLRQAEREAVESSGAVVEAMAAELRAWQDRAEQAESELAALRHTVLYRAAAPFLAVFRARRRIPSLVRSVARRLQT